MIMVPAAAVVAAVVPLALAASAPAAVPAGGGAGPDVVGILARTKTTTKIYALYLWTRATPTDRPARSEWSAEFHSGDLHRVETPRDRLVANCRTGEGFAYSAETGQSYSGAWIARTACGIDTNTPFEEVEWLGKVRTRFGPADRVKVVAGELVRRYDVSREGILLGTVFTERAAGKAMVLVNWATGVERKLPEKDIFSRESLARSVVPQRYKRAPASGG
jgi:hypothetical protein